MPAARAADAEDVAEGMRLFMQKGNCQQCHGWAGDGRKMDNQMPTGANLRESQLDRNNIVMTIKCGRPGRGMPAYDRLAYSDGRCYGQTKADFKGINMSRIMRSFYDHRNGVMFYTNPLGGMMDIQITNEAPNYRPGI
mgnify:CR=1 FL=1